MQLEAKQLKTTWCHFLLNFFALGWPLKVVLKAETVSEIGLNQLMFSLPKGFLVKIFRFSSAPLISSSVSSTSS